MASFLEVSGLAVTLRSPDGPVTVIDDVSFSMERGRTLALVGESGSGKSLTALALMRLLPGAARTSAGSVELGGTDLLTLGEEAMRALRGNRIAIIFQDSMTALNPVFTIGDQIVEAILLHRPMRRAAARERMFELLAEVHIASPRERANDYPHQLSGGMRQRVVIAMALACEPELLIADEPTTALDITTQTQILDLILELQARLHMAVLLITHDLTVVAEVAHDVAVMYSGRLVEYGPVETIFGDPGHPYTQGLLAASRITEHAPGTRLPEIRGTVPALANRPAGCAFAPRCPDAAADCRVTHPALRYDHDGRQRACFLPGAPAVRRARAAS